MSGEFLHVCKLVAEIIPGFALCVDNLLGSGSLTTRVVKLVDVVIEDVHVPVDMLLLPMSNFDVVLGMNWLNHYGMTIDYRGATLSFMIGDRSVRSKMVRKRPQYMAIMEICGKADDGSSLC